MTSFSPGSRGSSGDVSRDAVISPAEAVERLTRGEAVAFPTETVYGLGAIARDRAAVRRVFEVKGRPTSNPLIVHVADAAGARRVTASWPALAEALAEAFWPGPLSMVLPRGPGVPDEVTAGGATVAVRMPDHPIARHVIEGVGEALVAPSANPSGSVSPIAAKHVVDLFEGRVPVVDGGLCERGIESTVVDLTGPEAVVLRPGAVSRAEIAEVVGSDVELAGPGGSRGGDARPARSPGQSLKHYAPRARVILFDGGEWPDVAAEVHLASPGLLALITHRHERFIPPPHVTFFLDPTPAGYARSFYAALRTCDLHGVSTVFLERVPEDEAWEAVRDRVMRAGA